MVLRSQLLGLELRKSLTAKLYEKLLRLPVSGVAAASPGKLINLASGDMALIEQGAWSVPQVVGAPLASIFYLVLLFHIVRKTLMLDRKHCLLLLNHHSSLVLPLASPELSHPQSAAFNRVSH